MKKCPVCNQFYYRVTRHVQSIRDVKHANYRATHELGHRYVVKPKVYTRMYACQFCRDEGVIQQGGYFMPCPGHHKHG